MGRGEELPKSCYGKFRAAMLKAMAQGEKVLHKAAMRTHAIHLLARRFPNHYPSERQLMEISGKDGLPLIPAPENSFAVVIERDPRDEPEPAFRIVQPDGSEAVWIAPLTNGQEKPE
jgi:hypothetical protein